MKSFIGKNYRIEQLLISDYVLKIGATFELNYVFYSKFFNQSKIFIKQTVI